MPKASPIQNQFNAGEFSPLLYGRTDIDKYPAALTVSENGIPLIQGPWTRRPGTKFAAEVKDSTRDTRLVRFEFSTTQAYILEFGHLYVRFFRDNGRITLTSQDITGITKANPAVVTYAGADTYANGDRVFLSGVSGMSQVNNREFTVANVNAGANTFELSGVDSTSYDTYTSGGTVAEIYEIVSTYDEAELFELQSTQSADVLYIVHPDYAPRKLTRTGHTSWTLTAIDFQDGPYLPENDTTTTLTPAATSGTGVNVTASAITGINGGTGFQTTDVGRLIRIKHGSTWGWAKITSRTSTTVVVVDIMSNFGATTASLEWRLGLYSDTSGYPASVTFHEDRLVFGGAPEAPTRLDMSRTGDYETMSPTETDGTVVDDNAVSITLNANQVQEIQWIGTDEKGLLVGTVSGEWIVRPSAQSEALSPTNVSAKQSTAHGSTYFSALRVGRAHLFIQRQERKLRELAYVFEVDGFRAPDLTLLSEHITLGGLWEMTYQQEPHSIVWLARGDGMMLGFTYDREQNVLAWHRHPLGGVSTGNAFGALESVACIPSSDTTYDELWMVARRTIGGNQVRHIEYMTKFPEDSDAQEDDFYVDCGLTYDGAPADEISGLWHLNGETVSVLADGAAHPDCVVSNGKITLQAEYSVVQVGLKCRARGKTLRIEAGAADGTAQGKTKRINRVVFRVNRSSGFKYGKSFDDLISIPFRSASDNTGEAVPLFTGDKEVALELGYDKDGYVCWEQEQPLPLTLVAIMPQVTTQDR